MSDTVVVNVAEIEAAMAKHRAEYFRLKRFKNQLKEFGKASDEAPATSVESARGLEGCSDRPYPTHTIIILAVTAA